MPYELPPLPYDYAALEPYIDAKTMEIHHDKHHKAYVDKVNDALKDTEWSDKPIEQVLQSLDQLPENIRTKVRNNGGGHYNHSLFWPMMKNDGGGEPHGEIASAINSAFGSFEEFKKHFTDAAVNQFGSGWAWLAIDKDKKLHIHGLPNQDSPIMHGDHSILGLDVWEHAYYLHYQNRRAAYIDNFWVVVNWEDVEKRFTDPNYI